MCLTLNVCLSNFLLVVVIPVPIILEDFKKIFVRPLEGQLLLDEKASSQKRHNC